MNKPDPVNGGDGANAFDFLQLLDRGVEDPAEVAETVDQLLGTLLHVGPWNRQGEQQLDNLIVGEPVETRLLEPCPQALAMAVKIRGLGIHGLKAANQDREIFAVHRR